MDFLAKANTFVSIVEAGSFSRAARTLGLSLAAISRQVAALEGELGVTLLQRTTRTLHLTEEGRRFHEHAVKLVRDAEAARASVGASGAIEGNLVVSASVTLGVLRIVPALSKLMLAHPRLSLDLRLEDRAASLVGEGIDLAVRAGLDPPDTSSLIALRVATFERVVVAAPAYLRRAGTPRTIASLSGHALLGTGTTDRWRFVEGGEARVVLVESRLRVGTLLGVHAAALAGLGVALLPDFVVHRQIEEGALRRLLPAVSCAPVIAHALHRVESRGTPRIEAVIKHLRATLPL